MNRLAKAVAMILVLVAGAGLYQLKYRTQRLQEDVSGLEHQLVTDRAAIRVLNAEWTYLTRPARLAMLSKRYLDLKPTSADQIVPSVDVIARRDDPSAVMAQVDDFRAPEIVLARAPTTRPNQVAARTDPPVREAANDTPIREAKTDQKTSLFEHIKLVLMEGGNE